MQDVWLLLVVFETAQLMGPVANCYSHAVHVVLISLYNIPVLEF